MCRCQPSSAVIPGLPRPAEQEVNSSVSYSVIRNAIAPPQTLAALMRDSSRNISSHPAHLSLTPFSPSLSFPLTASSKCSLLTGSFRHCKPVCWRQRAPRSRTPWSLKRLSLPPWRTSCSPSWPAPPCWQASPEPSPPCPPSTWVQLICMCVLRSDSVSLHGTRCGMLPAEWCIVQHLL